jgi:acetyltransferase-like isoleucine patch superfamily enzyme
VILLDIILKIYEKILLKYCSPQKRATIFKKRGVRMGKGCQIFQSVGFGSEPYLVSLGDKVKITSGTKFITHDGGIEVLRNLDLLPDADYFGEINIGNNVFIGNHCIILPGVKIGDNVVIGAGSVVTKSIPSNSVCAGVPAKVLKSIDEYYEKLKNGSVKTKTLSAYEKKSFLIKMFDI